MDSCWKHSELKDKQLMVSELLAGEKELTDNYYGKFVMRNCNIEYYKKRGCLKEAGSYSSIDKVKRMFSDIVDTSKPVKLSQKRKRKSRDEACEGLDHEGVVKKKKLFEDEVSST